MILACDDGGERDERARRAPADPGQRDGGRGRPGAGPPGGGLPGSASGGRWPADFDAPLAPSRPVAVNEAMARPPDPPGGRSPADFDAPLAPSRPVAVNEAMARPPDPPGLTVPGPPAAGAPAGGAPATGQVTRLRELAAAIVVARAERLAGLADPADAFGPRATLYGPAAGDRHPSGLARPAVTPLNQALAGLEIVVACADHAAARDIAAGLAGPQGIGERWREAAAGLDYLSATARRAYGDGAWAMVAVTLGDGADCQAFAAQFGRDAPGGQDDWLDDLAARAAQAAGPPVSWAAARREFLAAREKATVLAAARAEVAAATARLADLRQEAATAYAAITDTEDTLRSLADQRVAAERSLRAAWHRRHAAARAVDTHARARPGLLRASLPAWLGGGRREWRARQAALGAALRDGEAAVSTAQQAVAQARTGFATAVQARAERAAALRRLTAECAACQQVIARRRQQRDGHLPDGPRFPDQPGFPDRPQFPDGPGCPDALRDSAAAERGEPGVPWADPELAAARTEVFLAALALHKSLLRAQAGRVRENLDALAVFLRGDGRADDRALLAAWQTFFLVVPVVCTTFAAVPGLFGGLGPETAGWHVIDGTGQAPAREVAGAAGRAKRTVTASAGPSPAPVAPGGDGDGDGGQP